MKPATSTPVGPPTPPEQMPRPTIITPTGRWSDANRAAADYFRALGKVYSDSADGKEPGAAVVAYLDLKLEEARVAFRVAAGRTVVEELEL